MSRILLSIVTICYRNPTDLLCTLETLRELPESVEIVVIDGSPDDRCAKVASAFERVRYSQQHDDGKYDAMNKGIAEARGDALLFINSGDQLASTHHLLELLKQHADRLTGAILYGDCKHRVGGGEITVPARHPRGENLRLGQLPSHQSTIIPRHYHERHPYDATMFFAADTKFLKRAYRELPAIYFPHAIGVFGHGGASTSPGGFVMLRRQYRELSQTHELTTREKASIAFLLVRRKLLSLVIGETGLQRLQAWRLAARNHRER